MKALLRTFIVSLLLVVGSVTQGWAQFRTTYPVSDPTYAAPPLELPAMTTSQQSLPYASNEMLDAGKALTSLGIGMFLVGECGTLNYISQTFGDSYVLGRRTAMNMCALTPVAGALLSLVGVPLWIVGYNQVDQKEGYQYLGKSKGFGMRVDLTGSIAPIVGVDVVAGYHFNPYLFLGAGVGQRFVDGYMAPVFVDARVTLSNKRVAPCFGFDVGGAYYTKNSAYKPFDLFGGFNFGVRIRHKSNDRSKGDWWIVSSAEATYRMLMNIGLRVGYSF